MRLPIDHVLAFVLAVLLPLRAALFGFRRLQRATPEHLPETRRRVYRDAILLQWGLVLAVLALWWVRGRHLTALGLEPRLTAGLMGVAAGSLVIVLLMIRQRAGALRDDEALDHLRARLRRLEVMLPHTRDEFRLFGRLSFTAGVCEEILYRGYLIWYLSAWMDVIPAAALSTAIFGIGHAYQGGRGILQTTAVGALLAGVYLVSGSLYLSMTLHFLMDLHSGHLMLKAYEREVERERETIAIVASRAADDDLASPLGPAPGSAPPA